jgi:RNA recognition motif-containing protein
MKIFAGKLSPRLNAAILEMIFKKHGEVTDARIIYDRHTGDSRCFGFVEMPDDEEAKKAIEALNETEVDGHTIVVKEAEERKRKFGPIF